MPRRPAAAAVEHLPERPNLEHLRKQARRRLRELRLRDAHATLACAQLEIARAYGFSSWPALKAFVDKGSPIEPTSDWPGYYRHDPALATNAVMLIVREAGALWFETAAGQRFSLRDQGDGRVLIEGLGGYFTPERDATGNTRAIVHHKADRVVRMERIEAVTGIALREAARAAQADQALPRTERAVDPAILERYIGDYASPLGIAMRVDVRFGRLHAQVAGQAALELLPESETSFFYRILPAQLSFVVADGQAVALVVHQNGVEQRLERVSSDVADQVAAGVRERLAEQQRPRIPVQIDPLLPDRYAGRYRLDGTREMRVTAEDGRLFAQITGQPRYEVHPESETRFFWTVVAAQISFITDADTVSHAVLHQNGRDVPLERVPDDEVGK